MQLTTSVAAVAVACALTLSACGNGSKSSEPPAGATGAVSAADAAPVGSSTAAASAATDCNYISPAQLSSIEGASYAQPTVFNNRICSWVGSDGNAVQITLTRNATAATWQDVLATVEADQTSGAPAPIPGLDDKAAGVGLEIAVQHGSTIIDIRNGDSPGFGKWPKSTAIANAIIAGLH